MLPADDRAAVRRALAKNAADRWHSCGDSVHALGHRGADPGRGRAASGEQEIPPLPARPDSDADHFPIPSPPPTPAIQAEKTGSSRPATTRAGPATSGRRPLRLRRTVPILATVLLAVVAMVFAFGERLRPSLPSFGGLLGSERRGFADTILKYRDRSYERAGWRKIQDAGTLQELADAGPRAKLRILLTGVAGWDDENVFITATRWGRAGVIFRHRNDRWSFLGETRDINMDQTRQRLLDQDTLICAGGHDIFTVSERGIIYHDEPGGERRCFADWAEICPLTPERFDVFYYKPGHACRVVNGKARTPQGKEALIRTLESTPPDDRSVGRIQLTRTLASGKVVAIFTDFSSHRLVILEDGIWRESSSLPKLDVTDFWVCSEGTTPDFLVAVGHDGKLYQHSFRGETHEMTMPREMDRDSAQGSLALFKVWGVSEDRFWVMARSGAVWGRANDEWRVVVPGFTGKDQILLDAWVSPTGKVIAVTRDQIYRLD